MKYSFDSEKKSTLKCQDFLVLQQSQVEIDSTEAEKLTAGLLVCSSVPWPLVSKFSLSQKSCRHGIYSADKGFLSFISFY